MEFLSVNLWRRLQSLAKYLRFVELCILVCFLSWLLTHLPFAVKISGEYFRKLLSLILCPISIFLLGNAIIVTLLAKSGSFSSESSSAIDNVVAELIDDFRSENLEEFTALLKEEIVFQDKEIISEENLTVPNKIEVVDEIFFPEDSTMEVKTSYRRTQSEKIRRKCTMEDDKKGKLRRSDTETFRKTMVEDKDSSMAEDGMNDEEFNRAIEAFIAKQVKFHRKERLSVVLHGQA
ncbi:uncharacterized protein LOC130808164 [Amaranthus tricolor]|uniref:uncharacterized protein LOC130808164 n=1 Tax=Amaranthus tricolor TaxID=29722 RepID=UPI00258BC8C8|nr:uncharacterized protein LOC130808164 [Amaranthus tricolor]